MKILVLAPYLPFPPDSGGALRVYNLLQQAAQRHEVFLAYPETASVTSEALASAHSLCAKLLPFPSVPSSYNRLDLRRLRAWRSFSDWRPLIIRDTVPHLSKAVAAVVAGLGSARPDLIHAHQFHTAQLALALKQKLGIKVLLDEQNVEAQIWRQLAHDAPSKRLDRKLVFTWEAQKLQRSQRSTYPSFDLVSAVSKLDQQELAGLSNRSDIALLPNGVDTRFFQRTTPLVPASDEILFTGTLGYEPNLDGLLYFYHEIWPLIQAERPKTRLLIVGRGAPARIQALDNGSDVRVIGPVADMRPYYERARVCVVPLRWGGGTRLKVLEALAMQVPLVSTGMGVSGLDLTLGDHYLCGDTAQSFASLTVRLLDIKGPARHLASAGRSWVEAHYDWDQIGLHLEELYQNLLN
jgi:glycosyltransferase involved in cell wall biosynthesis